jgi:hypothetical protein
LDWDDTHGKLLLLVVLTVGLTQSFGISPGRFFAVNEVKALFAHIVATYDVKFEEGKGVPRDFCIAGIRFPVNSNVMFKTRQK